MNESDKIEELTKKVKTLQNQMSVVIIILAIFVFLSLISFLQTALSIILSNPAVQFMVFATIGMAFFVALLIYIDSRNP